MVRWTLEKHYVYSVLETAVMYVVIKYFWSIDIHRSQIKTHYLQLTNAFCNSYNSYSVWLRNLNITSPPVSFTLFLLKLLKSSDIFSPFNDNLWDLEPQELFWNLCTDVVWSDCNGYDDEFHHHTNFLCRYLWPSKLSQPLFELSWRPVIWSRSVAASVSKQQGGSWGWGCRAQGLNLARNLYDNGSIFSDPGLSMV